MIRPLPMKALPFALLAVLAAPAALFGQGGPPFPPPLPPPPSPPENPTTPDRVLLGKALFWDEQLSSSGTMACGTCHVPEAGGADLRSRLDPQGSTNPWLDGLPGTQDDVIGSMGRILTQAGGDYVFHPVFRLESQVTRRKAPSVINAAYFPELFLDGRAGPTFRDPVTGVVVIPNLAALESQAADPPASDVEMAHAGEDWIQIASRIQAAAPLALASELPGPLATFIAGRTYPQLFRIAFGTPEVSPSRILMAIAAYERTLVSDQSPFDEATRGNPNALTQQQLRGFGVFNSPQTNCNVCHAGALTSDTTFRNIGVRPIAEDPGRSLVTGDPLDDGRFKVPSLRNVALRAPYFHNGREPTLEGVVAFYNRGGDFPQNRDPLIRPLGLTVQQEADLLAFLDSLTDPRVAAGLPPFDRPTLFSESNRRPVLYGVGSTRDGVPPPRAIAEEPPLLGNQNFTLGLKGGAPGAPSLLLFDLSPSIGGVPVGGILVNVAMSPAMVIVPLGPTTAGPGPGDGYTSVSFALPQTNPLPPGASYYLQWVLMDPFRPGALMATEGIEIQLF